VFDNNEAICYFLEERPEPDLRSMNHVIIFIHFINLHSNKIPQGLGILESMFITENILRHPKLAKEPSLRKIGETIIINIGTDAEPYHILLGDDCTPFKKVRLCELFLEF